MKNKNMGFASPQEYRETERRLKNYQKRLYEKGNKVFERIESERRRSASPQSSKVIHGEGMTRKDNTIWLASYPRSGNTWFRLLWSHYTGLPTFSVHQDGHRKRNPIPMKILKVPPSMYKTTALTKTHYREVPPLDTLPAVVLVRDGRDMAVSYWHYLKEIDNYNVPDGVLEEMIATGDIMFGSWTSWLKHWLIERATPASIVWTFDEITTRSPSEIIGRTLNALDIAQPDTDAEPPPDFTSLQKLDPAFFRRGVSRQFIDYPNLTKLFTTHQAKGMEMYRALVSVPAEARGLLFRAPRSERVAQ